MTKNTFFSLLFLLAGLNTLAAQTTVDQSPIDGAVWTSGGSPYHIAADIEIIDLEIEPGVTVLFDGAYSLNVSGMLNAQGFFSDSIYFKAADINSAGWNGISFSSEDFSSILTYCRMEGALDQALLIDGGEAPDISNCRIIHNDGSGLRIRNSSVELKNCVIADNGKNGVLLDMAQLTVLNSIISRNKEAGVSSSHALDIITLTNSVVTDNGSFGIRSAYGTVTARNSILFDNTPSELSSVEGNTQITYCAIGNNTVYPGAGNINNDPLFTDRVSYALAETSPCIDSGNPDTAFNDKFFPPSLGTSRNDMGAYGGGEAGNWYAPLRIIPESIDFGSVTQDSSKSMSLRIKNYRHFSISVSEVIFNPSFLSADKNSFTVPAGGLSTLELTFSPKETDAFFTTLNLRTNGYGIVSAPVSGRGVVPEIEITQSRLDFGTVTTGADSSLKLDIVNWGDDTLRIHNLYTTNAAFTVSTPSLNIVPGYALETVQVTFAPDSAATYRDSLIILSNDPDEQRTAIPLIGSGEDGPLLETEPSALAFGQVLVKTDSTLHLQIKNRGDRTLNISHIALYVPDTTAGAFQLQNMPSSFPVIVLADSSFEMDVVFSPLQTGADAAGIIFTSNDFYNARDTVFLSGKGVAPNFSTSENVLDFGRLNVGQDSLISLHIVNAGDALLKLFSFTIDGQDTLNPVFTFSNNDTLPIEITPGASLSLPLIYSPRQSGADTALLVIAHNDPFKDTVAVVLNGYGLAPRMVLSCDQLDFGALPFTADSLQNITLFNRGEKTLYVFSDSLKITPETLSPFSLKNPPTGDRALEPGDSATFLIRFLPGSLGVKNGILHIVSNDPLRGRMDISLSGTGTDTEPATVLLDTAYSSASFITNKSAILSFDISAPAGIDSAFLFLRKGGQGVFSRSALARQEQSNRWQIPLEAARLSERGLEYCIQIYHGFRTTLSPENGFEQPLFIPVSVPLLSFPRQTLKKVYQQISIPLNTNGQTLATLFEDDLGKYNSDNYRFFDYTQESGLREIKNLDSTLPPGKSIWLITKEAQLLDVENSVSVSSAAAYELKLKQGWNMIAAPFAFTSSWTEANPFHPLYFYNGNEWTFSTEMAPYQGYATYVNRDTSVFIAAKESGTSAVLAKSPSFIEGEDWHIQLQAQSGSFKDRFNFAGVHAGAARSEDRYDYPEPPMVGASVALYFIHDKNPKPFATDYRSPTEEGFVFNFEISGNTDREKSITLTPYNLPSEYDWAVFSPLTGLRYNKAHFSTRRHTQRFILVVGSAEFISRAGQGYAAQPLSFRLSQNYPNPFNPQTVAKYQLPLADRITIEVYNILGQRIKTLLKNEPLDAGYYKIKWDGADGTGKRVSAGIYFLRLRSKNFTKTVKMILQK